MEKFDKVSEPQHRQVHPKVVGEHDWSELYGLRRQSAATTALWAAGGSLMLAEASGQPDAESGLALLAAAVQKITDNVGMLAAPSESTMED